MMEMNSIKGTVLAGVFRGLEFVANRLEDVLERVDFEIAKTESESPERVEVVYDSDVELGSNGEFRHLGIDPNREGGITADSRMESPSTTFDEFDAWLANAFRRASFVTVDTNES